MHRIYKLATISMLAIVLTVTPFSNISALSGSEFKAGRIIDDAKFYGAPTMSISSIQSFLDSKVPVCDTWGTKMHNGVTRAQYAASRGVSTPFTCIKSARDTVQAKSPEAGLCNGLPAGSGTAAEIIYWVAESCGINPQVLIVLIQKEQSLITDDWAWPSQYRIATGYGCPDTAPCDTQYYGFFNQVWNAARQFKRYGRDANLFNYRAGVNNYIQYNPNANCGGSAVFIENKATAALYNYTPYQPNQAALNNLYGTGDGCSAYGNRNFWRIFNDWFGSPTSCSTEITDTRVHRLYDAKTNKHYYSTNTCEVNTLVSKVGYKYEGVAFNSFPADTPNATPVYRLYNKSTLLHFYTTSQADVDHAVSGAGYTYEGIAFFAAPPGTQGVAPLYRLYNPRTFRHLWVGSQVDIDFAVRQAGFTYEGPTFYVR